MHTRLVMGSLAILGFLACSGEPTRGAVDTAGGPVDTAPGEAPSALVPMTAGAAREEQAGWELRGFASHWAIFEKDGETRFVHTALGTHVDQEGVVVGDADGFGELDESGLLGNDDGWRPAMVGDRVMLRGLEGRLRVVSLQSEDGLAQLWEDDGPTDLASFSPTGRFASWTNGDFTKVHVVDLDEGREVVVPAAKGDVSGLRWIVRAGDGREAAVVFSDEAQAHVVDLDRDMRATNVAAGGPFDFWVSPSDASVLVLSEHVGAEDRVRVFRGGAGVASVVGRADDVLFDATGDRIAWSEPRRTIDGDPSLHVTDTRSGVDLRIRPSGDCSLATERLVKLDGAELVTDAECSPGCPSIPTRPELRAYDARSGALLRKWQGLEEPSWNDHIGALVAQVEQAAKAAGAPRDATLLAPVGDVALVARTEGLAVVDAKTGAVRAILQGSRGLSPADARFSQDGTVVAAASRDHAPAAWSAGDGGAILPHGESAH